MAKQDATTTATDPTDACTYDACCDRPGFGDIGSDAPNPYFTDAGEYVLPFTCPEHGTVYENVYVLQSVHDPRTKTTVHDYEAHQ